MNRSPEINVSHMVSIEVNLYFFVSSEFVATRSGDTPAEHKQMNANDSQKALT